jgi:hypothetical protein
LRHHHEQALSDKAALLYTQDNAEPEQQQLEDTEEAATAVYPHCSVQELTAFAQGVHDGSSGGLVELEDIRRYFCGSGLLPSDLVDDVLHEVLEVSSGSIADAVRACAGMIGLELTDAPAPAAAAASNNSGRGNAQTYGGGRGKQQNGHSSSNGGNSDSKKAAKGNTTAGAAAAGAPSPAATSALAAAVIGEVAGEDDDELEDSPLHKRLKEKLSSGSCSERDLTSMADQLKGREGFNKIKKTIKKMLKAIREEREAARQAAAQAAAAAKAAKEAQRTAPPPPAAAAATAATAAAGEQPSSAAAALNASSHARGKQYALQYLAVKPDGVLDIEHSMCGWFIGKNGSRLKEMQVIQHTFLLALTRSSSSSCLWC